MTVDQNLLDIVTRSYLVDPDRTDMDLRAMDKGDLASTLRIDYETGRLSENFETLTEKRVVMLPLVKGALAGAVMESTAPNAGKPTV